MRRIRAVLFGAVLSFSIVACGDDDDDDDTSNDGGTQSDTGVPSGDAGHDASTGGDASIDGSTGGNLDGGGDASQADTGTPSGDSGTDASIADAASTLDGSAGETWAKLYADLIAPKCSGCHGASHRSGLNLSSADDGYAGLINKPAGSSADGGVGSMPECTGMNLTRVVPGNAATSLLVLKLEPSPPCGMRMPRNAPALGDAEIARVRAWVTAGAPR